MPMISSKSLKTRLKLVISLLSRSTDAWIEDLTSMLEESGFLLYKNAQANMTPLEFLSRLHDYKSIDDIKHLDYSKIISHDFFQETPNIGWNSEPEVARFIGDLVYNIKAINVIETGCFVGFGSAHLAKALSEIENGRNLFIVDSNRGLLEITKRNLEKLSLDKVSVHLLEGKSWDQEVLESVPDDIDMMFLDSDHSYEGIKKELDSYLPKLARRGLAIVHDSILWPGVRRAIVELPAQYDRITFGTSHGCGVSVVMRSTQMIDKKTI
jgi:predicted O-methyltransferase YrrM